MSDSAEPNTNFDPGKSQDDSNAQALMHETLTLFMRTESVIRSTRITSKGEIVQSTDDLASGIEGVARVFKHDGDAVKASNMLTQIQNQLNSRFKNWEAETKRLQQSKLEVHNSPSGDQLRKMAAENSAVKSSVNTAAAKLRALITALSQFESNHRLTSPAGQEAGQRIDPNKLSEVGRVVFDLLGDETEVPPSSARKTGFGVRTREAIVDHKKRVFLVTQWSPTPKGNLELTTWLVPKHPVVARQLDAADFELMGSIGEAEFELQFQLTTNTEDWPLRQDIREFFDFISKQRFKGIPVPYLKARNQVPVPFSEAVLDCSLNFCFTV